MAKTEKYYRDFYGCTASIKEKPSGFILTIRLPNGQLSDRKTYKTFRGARIALGRSSEVWNEQ